MVCAKWNNNHPDPMSLMNKKPWRKILYEEQDYPDNYVDKAQFLNGLKKNCEQLHSSYFATHVHVIYSNDWQFYILANVYTCV